MYIIVIKIYYFITQPRTLAILRHARTKELATLWAVDSSDVNAPLDGQERRASVVRYLTHICTII